MTTCIIPAAGRSTRFQELGKHYPKCVLPYQGKPIIQHIVNNVAEAISPSRFIVIAGDQHLDDIRSALVGVEHKVDVIPLRTDGLQGPGTSIYQAMAYLISEYGDDDCFVHLSDMVLSVDALSTFWKGAEYTAQVSFSVRKSPDGDFRRWCVYDEATDSLIDKPSVERSLELKTRRAWILDGLYFFRSSVVADVCGKIDPYTLAWREGEFQISELLNAGSHKLPVHSSHPILDFGTVEEYLNNKGAPRSREFNTVSVLSKHEFVKTSTDGVKLAAEVNIYQNAPDSLKSYFPRVLSFDGVGSKLTMENIRSVNLRDLYVYIDRDFQTWARVFKEVREFQETCVRHSCSQDKFWKAVLSKTRARVATNASVFDASEVNEFIVEFVDAIDVLDKVGPQNSFYHGDLHFANMFYCFTYGDLKLVDPRGEFVGNVLYDVAKLMHSVYGRYDWIDGEFYSHTPDGSVNFYDRGTGEVQRAFEFVYQDLLSRYRYELLMLTASLFLSMIPLHTHSSINQALYYAEFKRLWLMAREHKHA